MALKVTFVALVFCGTCLVVILVLVISTNNFYKSLINSEKSQNVIKVTTRLSFYLSFYNNKTFQALVI